MKTLLANLKSVKTSLYESILDDEDVLLGKLDGMFDIWKAKNNINKYKKIIENIRNAVSYYPCKDTIKKYDSIHNDDLIPDVYYIQFHHNNIGPCFSVFQKDSDYIDCRFIFDLKNNKKKTVISWMGLNERFIRNSAHPVESTFKIPTEMNGWVEELKKHAIVKESLLDDENSQLDKLDPEAMFGIWNATTADEFNKYSDNIISFLKNNYKTIKSHSVNKNYIKSKELKYNKYYIGVVDDIDFDTKYSFNLIYKSKKESYIIEIFLSPYRKSTHTHIEYIDDENKSIYSPHQLYEIDNKFKLFIDFIDGILNITKK